MTRALLPVALTALVALTGCAVNRPAPQWEQQRATVLGIEDWSFTGRMAVKAEDPDAPGGQLSVRWQQRGDESRVRLSGPLGAGAWELLWRPDAIVVTDADGERTLTYTGPDAAEQFMRAELGWAFPADSIRYWVRGLPDPASPATTESADDGRLAAIEQHGWRVVVDRYRDAAGLQLPAKLTMTGRGVRLRMAIGRWELAEG